MNPALLGFLRGLGVVILTAVLTYLGNADNIAFIGNPAISGLIAALALAFEHGISPTGTAFFGAVRV